jgi:biotin operon repressor/DNA-binding MarR family transcriptional regulator
MDQISFDDGSVAFKVPPFEFLSAPGFAETRDRLIAGKLALYEGSHLFNRLILEEGRFLCYLAALSLHASQDIARPPTWLTLGRLQREVIELGVASRNRVEAQVSCLRKYGFLTQQPHASDRRVRLLVPSAALLARDAGILGLFVSGLSDFGLSPTDGHTGPLAPDLHRAMRRATLPLLPGLSRIIRRHLPLAPFFAHDCGYMILLLLLRGGRESGDNTISTGYQRLATQTGVSRTHVRRIVEAARDAGLLTTTARGGHDIRLTPAMWNAADRWFADNLALTDLLLREAGMQAQPAAAA